ncbi:NADPH-dependent oxidoreductase [Spirochaeta cellobiosiphila]|uniref:NADPH-dependent oxidoreductase n=1 Tax=Spirochaeta cellobiosiphila TaxID=504483 RepID=UPI0004209070|nr:NADPH-dependent oxidoreductase [Spirochaeta cellobiosiphila]
MNSTIDTIKNHRSIRSYTDQAVDDKMIDEILAAAQAMPNSINAQQTSVIVVKNLETRKKLAELSGGNPWIVEAPVFLVFIADFYKTDLSVTKNQATQVIHESIEGTVVGAVDAGLNLGGAIVAAESLGLGIVPIGGIRRNPQGVIDLLNLPEKTFPLCGLAIGHPKGSSDKKPRLPMRTFRHDEVYNADILPEAIEEYDEKMEAYYKEIGREQSGNWSKLNARLYQMVYYPEVYPTMVKQGFKNDK